MIQAIATAMWTYEKDPISTDKLANGARCDGFWKVTLDQRPTAERINQIEYCHCSQKLVNFSDIW